MNLEALESFRLFSETLNFTHAAKQRHITQPALHKQIQVLGESLGVDLYRKRGRTLELTEAGVTLAKFSREIVDRTTQLKGKLHNQGVAGENRVTLSAGRGSYLYLLSDAIRAYTNAYPRGMKLRTEDHAGTFAAVRSGEAHLGVTVLIESPPDLEAKLIHEMAPQLIVPKNHKLAGRKSIGLKALDGLPLICPSPPSKMRETIGARLSADGLEFNPVLDANGWDLLMHFASLNLGAAIVNGCCRPPQGMQAIRINGLPATRYYLISHPEEFAFPELQWMRECILQNVSHRLF